MPPAGEALGDQADPSRSLSSDTVRRSPTASAILRASGGLSAGGPSDRLQSRRSRPRQPTRAASRHAAGSRFAAASSLGLTPLTSPRTVRKAAPAQPPGPPRKSNRPRLRVARASDMGRLDMRGLVPGVPRRNARLCGLRLRRVPEHERVPTAGVQLESGGNELARLAVKPLNRVRCLAGEKGLGLALGELLSRDLTPDCEEAALPPPRTSPTLAPRDDAALVAHRAGPEVAANRLGPWPFRLCNTPAVYHRIPVRNAGESPAPVAIRSSSTSHWSVRSGLWSAAGPTVKSTRPFSVETRLSSRDERRVHG